MGSISGYCLQLVFIYICILVLVSRYYFMNKDGKRDTLSTLHDNVFIYIEDRRNSIKNEMYWRHSVEVSTLDFDRLSGLTVPRNARAQIPDLVQHT